MATTPPAGLPPLEVRGARRAFGAGRGLDGVDLRLERGEIYGSSARTARARRASCGRSAAACAWTPASVEPAGPRPAS